jgi:hypothetical protein
VLWNTRNAGSVLRRVKPLETSSSELTSRAPPPGGSEDLGCGGDDLSSKRHAGQVREERLHVTLR